MFNCRYHIHVACSPGIAPELLDGLTTFFEQTAFLTFDLLDDPQQSAAYSHRCIERCDYVLIIIEDSYGQRNNAGVSQLHLSYAYARSKNKPMEVLVKTHLDTEHPPKQQLSDFIGLIEKDIDHLHYFNDQVEMVAQLTGVYEALVKGHAGLGWVRGLDAIEIAAQQSNLALPLSKSVKLNDIHANFNKNIGINMEALKAGKTAIAPVININLDPEQKEGAQETSMLSDTPLQDVSLEDTVTLRYSAHAYEAGNLSVVDMSVEVSWREILTQLVGIPMPFSAHSLQRCLNEVVFEPAERDIKDKMTGVHAVARCKVISADITWVQTTLEHMGWINPTPKLHRHSRKMWSITERAQSLIK